MDLHSQKCKIDNLLVNTSNIRIWHHIKPLFRWCSHVTSELQTLSSSKVWPWSGLGSSRGPIIEPDEASSVCTLELAKLASDGNFKIYGMFMRINKGTLKLFHGWRWGPHSQNFNHLFVWWGMWTFSGISILFSEGIDLQNTIESEFEPIPYWVYEVCVCLSLIFTGAGLLWKLCNSKTVNVISDLNWCHGSAWHVSYR